MHCFRARCVLCTLNTLLQPKAFLSKTSQRVVQKTPSLLRAILVETVVRSATLNRMHNKSLNRAAFKRACSRLVPPTKAAREARQNAVLLGHRPQGKGASKMRRLRRPSARKARAVGGRRAAPRSCCLVGTAASSERSRRFDTVRNRDRRILDPRQTLVRRTAVPRGLKAAPLNRIPALAKAVAKQAPAKEAPVNGVQVPVRRVPAKRVLRIRGASWAASRHGQALLGAHRDAETR